MVTTRQLRRIFFGLGIAALVVYLGGFVVDAGRELGSVILIFLFATMLNLLLLPPVRWLRRLRLRGHPIPYTLAVFLVAIGAFLLIAGLVTLSVPYMVRDLREIIDRLGEYSEEVSQLYSWALDILASLGMPVTSVEQVIDDYASNLQGLVGQAATEVLQGLTSVAAGAINFVLVLIVTVYMMLNWDPVLAKLRRRLPTSWSRYLATGVSTVESAFGAYMLGVITEVVLFAIAVAVVLRIADVDPWLFPAVISGLLLAVPIVGALIGLLLPVLIALLDSWTVAVFWVGIPLLIIQAVLENLVRPNVVGQVAGVNPLALIASVLVGAALLGFWGILFGVPAGVLISLILRAIFLRWADDARAREDGDAANSEDADPAPAEND
ncbi:MAG: AI-2E family transporter [Chloroflexi bacterium]|nr:AI-2E family transporter [Chloroflexota bacterium]MXX65771.1 AI-2E family transporter [Chloroflexota bacterium]MXX99900.1 AI-2E family transporter [Chloroflexota bacterium]MXY13108.1 AI-2E family transporter [Chloroflexota bacterium]MYC47395.1 AI-2E family transporter [Chloroflexota bacterium]